MKYIYAIAVYTERNVIISSTAIQQQQRVAVFSEMSQNFDEAIGIGYKKSGQLFPSADGWITRYVVAEVVNDGLIIEFNNQQL